MGWLTEMQSLHLNDQQREAVSLELADILIYLVRMADWLGIDLLAAARRKVVLNTEKYPAGQCRAITDRPAEPQL